MIDNFLEQFLFFLKTIQRNGSHDTYLVGTFFFFSGALLGSDEGLTQPKGHTESGQKANWNCRKLWMDKHLSFIHSTHFSSSTFSGPTPH